MKLNEIQAPLGMKNRNSVLSHCLNSVFKREREHFSVSPITEVPREIL